MPFSPQNQGLFGPCLASRGRLGLALARHDRMLIVGPLRLPANTLIGVRTHPVCHPQWPPAFRPASP